MNRSGFSLIEIMVGMLIFAVGFMALSASTAFVSSQIQAADVRTERNVAFQQATERLHSIHFDSVQTVSGSDALVAEYGGYATAIFLLGWATGGLGFGVRQTEYNFASANLLALQTRQQLEA